MLYNDTDKFVCEWLRNLVDAGHLPAGEVVETPIQELDPADIPDTFHTFAGIGGWPLALRMAGWPDDRPVWTGSCPCQPFSSAGKRKGTDDERHLWPAFRDLIAECRPPVVFGEQVASKAGREWLAGVRADLEALGYAVGAADLCAAGVGAPHIRQRLYWVADAGIESCERHTRAVSASQSQFDGARFSVYGCHAQRSQYGVTDGDGLGNAKGDEAHTTEQGQQQLCNTRRVSERLGDAGRSRPPKQRRQRHEPERPSSSVWDDCGLVRCVEPTKDGGTVTKYRRAPLEPSLFPLADGVPGRVGLLRGAGNAIVPQVAAAFVRTFMEAQEMVEVAG